MHRSDGAFSETLWTDDDNPCVHWTSRGVGPDPEELDAFERVGPPRAAGYLHRFKCYAAIIAAAIGEIAREHAVITNPTLEAMATMVERRNPNPPNCYGEMMENRSPLVRVPKSTADGFFQIDIIEGWITAEVSGADMVTGLCRTNPRPKAATK